jgi:hypothetical protein
MTKSRTGLRTRRPAVDTTEARPAATSARAAAVLSAEPVLPTASAAAPRRQLRRGGIANDSDLPATAQQESYLNPSGLTLTAQTKASSMLTDSGVESNDQTGEAAL